MTVGWYGITGLRDISGAQNSWKTGDSGVLSDGADHGSVQMVQYAIVIYTHNIHMCIMYIILDRTAIRYACTDTQDPTHFAPKLSPIP